MPSEHSSERLQARNLSLSFGTNQVLDDFSLSIPNGKMTIVIGPNACGKSTLLRSLSRLEQPQTGAVYLDGKALSTWPTRKVAKELAILPQMPTAPEGITVLDLVARGRTPHQSAWRQWSKPDEEAVYAAMQKTGLLELASLRFASLSGGQKQRVWIAMALAQQTELLLLDEPTTFLDLSHQIELLDLLGSFNLQQKTTIVLVLHDINLAARYADHLVAMREGQIITQGQPNDVINEDIMKHVFDLDCRIIKDPVKNTPLVIPL